MRIPLALIVAIAVALLAAAASASPNFVIRRDNDIGGFSLSRNGTLNSAMKAFGTPTSRQAVSYDTCTVVWSTYGIQAEFSQPSADPCGAHSCHNHSNISGRQWKTDKGLHIGDPLKRLRKLYPGAQRYIGSDWAVIRRPFGGTLVPTLLATLKGTRVTAFVIKSPWLLTC